MCKEGGGSTNRSGEWVYTVQQTAQDSGVQQTAQVLEVYTPCVHYTIHQKVRGSDVQQSARGKGVH